jgi:putative ABC transport system permease protein
VAARRALGGVARVTELHRDERSLHLIEDARRDVRYAFRSLGRSPAFSLVTIGTLAMGIGSATAIFCALYTVLLKQPPNARSGRTLRIVENATTSSPAANTEPRTVNLSADELAEIRRARSVARASIGTLSFMTIVGGNETARLEGARVSAESSQMGGVSALVRRRLEERDEAADSDRTIVLSEGVWRRYFGEDPGVLGRVLTLEDVFAREPPAPYVVVGVMPATIRDRHENPFLDPVQAPC